MDIYSIRSPGRRDGITKVSFQLEHHDVVSFLLAAQASGCFLISRVIHTASK